MSILTEHRSPEVSASPRRPSAWRELATRHSGGITVALYWRPEHDEVVVEVSDEQTGETFVVEPPRSAALAAFYHPYALRTENGDSR